MRDLCTAALLVGICLWVEGSAFEPLLQDGGSIAYGLVSLSFGDLAGSLALASVGILALHTWISRRASRPLPGARSRASTRYLQPIGWIAITLVPLVNVIEPAAGRAPELTYVLYDLRWAWWGAIAVAVFRAIDPPIRVRLSNAIRVATLVVVPVAAAWMFTPHLRFTEIWHGDEPKYLRFVETFYQGHGFDISSKKRMPELSPGEAPRVLDNFAHLGRAVPEELRLLVDDVSRAFGFEAPPRLLSGEPGPGLFFDGKHAGTVYQLHNPGLSFLLFPAYYVDRQITGSGVGYQDEFPARMPAVHGMLLAMYVAFGLALHRLLMRWTPNAHHAWLLALAGVLSLPAGAFAFQMYPEIAAGAIIFLVVAWLIDGRPAIGAASAYGALAGFLPWLHVRFGIVTIVLAAWALITRCTAGPTGPALQSTQRATRIAFLAGAGLMLVALSFYTYRLTGRLLPTATYGSDAPLALARVPHGLAAFLFDRVWGLFPHAPIYLVALAGLGVTWRRNRTVTVFLLMLIAAVAVPASAHGFWAAGATPGRYLVSVAPLLLLFGADGWAAWSSRRVFRAALAAAAALSLETVVRYNLDHVKEVGPLVASGLAGWRANLLFPSLGGESWTATRWDVALLVAWWLGVISIVIVSRPRASGRLALEGQAEPGGLHADAAMGFATVAVLGVLLSSIAPVRILADYLVPPRLARERFLGAFAALPRCAVCAFSERGLVSPTAVLDNAVRFVEIRVERGSPGAGRPITIGVRPRSASGDYIIADLVVDLGDGEVTSVRRHFGDLRIVHTYATAGAYEVTATVRASNRQETARLVLTAMP